MTHKIPVSTLVVVHTAALEVLLLERADHPGYWQSVTGSQDAGETLRRDGAARGRRGDRHWTPRSTSCRTGTCRTCSRSIPCGAQRYAPGVTHNTEHVFGLRVPQALPVRVEPREHLAAQWLPWREAAERVFSWSNRRAILMLPERHS